MNQELAFQTVTGLQSLLRSREVSPREALDTLAARIEAVDPTVAGYLSYDLEDARRQADAADVNLPLGGVPIAIKDVISVAGHPCGCASHILDGYRAPYDATCIARLRKAGSHPVRAFEHGRICDGIVHGKQRQGRHTQPLGPVAGTRRFERRFGGDGRGAHGVRLARHGHRRVHPATGRAVRRGGFQTQLRADF